jgi:hypothetical protein
MIKELGCLKCEPKWSISDISQVMISSMLMLLTLNYWAFSSVGGCAPTPTQALPPKERAKIELGGEQAHS